MVSAPKNLMTMHHVCPAHSPTPTADPQKSARISETAEEATRAEVIALENQGEVLIQGEEAAVAVVLCPGFETA
jgi:hypothetical protein